MQLVVELRNDLREGHAVGRVGVGLDFVRRRIALARPPASLELVRSEREHLCRVRLPA